MVRRWIARAIAILACVCLLRAAGRLAPQIAEPKAATPITEIRYIGALEALGYAYRDADEPEKAIEVFERAIRQQVFLHANAVAIARNRIALAECYMAARNFTKAQEQLNEALRLSRNAQSEREDAQALAHMGWASAQQHNTADAVRFFQDATAGFKRLGDAEDEALAENNLGFVYLYNERNHDAATVLSDAVRLFVQTQDKRGQVAASNNLGMAYDRLGEKEKADKLGQMGVDFGLLCNQRYPLLFVGIRCAPVGAETTGLALERVEKAKADLKEAQGAVSSELVRELAPRLTSREEAEEAARTQALQAEMDRAILREAQEAAPPPIGTEPMQRSGYKSPEFLSQTHAAVERYPNIEAPDAAVVGSCN